MYNEKSLLKSKFEQFSYMFNFKNTNRIYLCLWCIYIYNIPSQDYALKNCHEQSNPISNALGTFHHTHNPVKIIIEKSEHKLQHINSVAKNLTSNREPYWIFKQLEFDSVLSMVQIWVMVESQAHCLLWWLCDIWNRVFQRKNQWHDARTINV